MPELPEVETVVRVLREQIHGRRLKGARSFHRDVYSGLPLGRLRGSSVERLGRRGKLAWIAFDNQLLLTVHLRMTGHLWLARDQDPRPPHTHFELAFDDGFALRFRDPRRFGRVRLIPEALLQEEPFVRTLGPEPGDLQADQLADALRRRRGSIKGALLDQSLVAGLGNIYVDEILFRSGLHPELPSCCVKSSERARLLESIAAVLDAAIESGGSSIRDYRNPKQEYGDFQRQHAVFGRDGENCLSCGTTIRKTRVAGRGTHFCPRCQPRRRRKSPRMRDGN